MTATDTDYRGKVIFSRDGQSPEQGMDDTSLVTKLVIGVLDKGKTVTFSDVEAWIDNWQDLNKRFPNLTHLHLWGIEKLVEIPQLPEGLQCLDIRNCPELTTIDPIPNQHLDQLVLINLKALDSISIQGSDIPSLNELIVDQCPKVHPQVLSDWLKAARGSQLRLLELVRLPQLKSIPCWPESLLDIRCNDCLNLEQLPKRDWPEKLRRLELSNAQNITQINPFPKELDYVNLAGMAKLASLPKRKGDFPSTLYLFESAITEPPMFQHGSEAGDNVAKATKAYFDYQNQVGTGQVERCKIVLLGNGGAGKTCLSLFLSGKDPKMTDKKLKGQPGYIGTTHGVMFHTAPEGISEDVDAHLWDFGGQEIYHNTHRLFLSTGSIFILLWNPDEQQEFQDGVDSGKIKKDEEMPRPLSYWLDYIDMNCQGRKPKIAIVCSKRTEGTAQLRQTLDLEIGERDEPIPCYFINSFHGTGQVDDLREWIKTNGGKIVEQQGNQVPSYWQIAQEMVEQWIKKIEDETEKKTAHLPDSFSVKHRQMRLCDFGDELLKFIDERRVDFDRLDQTLSDKPDWVKREQVHHVLDFLDNIGWVYWKPKLGINSDVGIDESRVIIGQRWALDGIYTLLEREESSPGSKVRAELEAEEGIFSLSKLKKWGWGELGYTEVDQQLLLSFLRENGLCFGLDHREENRRWIPESEKEYLCLSYLDEYSAAWKRKLHAIDDGEFKSGPPIEFDKSLHRGHWDQLLAAFGEHFGRTAEYANNGILLSTEKDGLEHRALITAQFSAKNLSGEIQVESFGPKVASFHQSIHSFVSEKMERYIAGRGQSEPSIPQDIQASEEIEVFISYKRAGEQQPKEFGEPAKKLNQALRQIEGVRPYFDETDAKGKSLNRFMGKIGTSHFVIVFYSDHYFLSPYCVWEFTRYIRNQGILAKNLILIQQEDDCLIRKIPEGRNQLTEIWEQKSSLENELWDKSHVIRCIDELKPIARNLFQHDAGDIWDREGVIEMSKHTEGDILDIVLKRMGLRKT